MNPTIKQNLSNKTIWFRLLFMVFFGLVLWVTLWVAGLLMLFQFLTALITGQPNGSLHGVNQSVARYVEQIFQYLLFCTDKKPFPFSTWPSAAVERTAETGAETATSSSAIPESGAEVVRDPGSASRSS